MEMKVFTLKNIILAALCTALLSSCLKRKEYPPTPVIEYTDFVKYGHDSADFVFHFTDGDGDIGLSEADTFGSFAPSQPYYYNLVMTYFYKDGTGNWQPYDAIDSTPAVMDTLKNGYRIPDITPEGQNKVLDGEIHIKLLAPYIPLFDKNFKFEAYIYDRELHKSNMITTPELTPP
jgi:hypothetical protein